MRDFILVLLASIIGTGFAWLCNYQSFIGIDDANIFMVYMQNLAQGEGFVYNLGGERVEGFSSFLWTLMGALFFATSSHPEICLMLLSLLVVSYSLLQVLRFLDKEMPSHPLATRILFLSTLVLIPGYYEWTVLSLMETGLWGSLLILLSLDVLNPCSPEKPSDSKFCILIALLVITRPESLLWGPFFIFLKMVFSPHNKIRIIIKPSLVFLSAVAILIGWRLFYFGYPLPNTYYAKVSSSLFYNISLGASYHWTCFVYNPFFLLIGTLAGFDLWRMVRKKEWDSRLVFIGVIGITLLIPFLVGGDHFRYSRFLQPTWPLFVAYGILALSKTSSLLHKNYATAAVALITMIILFLPTPSIISNLKLFKSPVMHEWQVSISGREKSQKMNEFFSLMELPSQGVVTAGAQAFYYNGFTYDLLALNNVAMAHAEKDENRVRVINHDAFNKKIFFEQKPDLLWSLGSAFTSADDKGILKVQTFDMAFYQNVFREKLFWDLYSSVLITRHDSNQGLKIFASKSFLKTLDPSKYSYRKIICR